jgi:hypothetical protein
MSDCCLRVDRLRADRLRVDRLRVDRLRACAGALPTNQSAVSS